MERGARGGSSWAGVADFIAFRTLRNIVERRGQRWDREKANQKNCRSGCRSRSMAG